MSIALFLLAGCDGTLVDNQHPNGTRRIGPTGGKLVTTFGALLTIPAGALAEEVRISVSQGAPIPGTINPVEIAPEGLVLAEPATLALTFPPETGDAERLKVMVRGESGWEPLEGWYFDPIERTVTGQMRHFSVFAIVHSGEVCQNGLDDDLDGRTDCTDSACANDQACHTCGGQVCSPGTACCPYSSQCYNPLCPSCCLPPSSLIPDGGSDAGQGEVCGATICSPTQTCCRFNGRCVTKGCTNCCGPVITGPTDGGQDAGHDAGGKVDSCLGRCNSQQSCCAATGLCVSPSCATCCR